MASDLAGFRRRVAEQREATTRDLGIVQSRVLSRDTSNLSPRSSECGTVQCNEGGMCRQGMSIIQSCVLSCNLPTIAPATVNAVQCN